MHSLNGRVQRLEGGVGVVDLVLRLAGIDASDGVDPSFEVQRLRGPPGRRRVTRPLGLLGGG